MSAAPARDACGTHVGYRTVFPPDVDRRREPGTAPAGIPRGRAGRPGASLRRPVPARVPGRTSSESLRGAADPRVSPRRRAIVPGITPRAASGSSGSITRPDTRARPASRLGATISRCSWRRRRGASCSSSTPGGSPGRCGSPTSAATSGQWAWPSSVRRGLWEPFCGSHPSPEGGGGHDLPGRGARRAGVHPRGRGDAGAVRVPGGVEHRRVAAEAEALLVDDRWHAPEPVATTAGVVAIALDLDQVIGLRVGHLQGDSGPCERYS